MNLLARSETWIGILAAFVAVFTINAVRSGRMMGRLGVPALLRQDAPQMFWIAVAARTVLVVLLALTAVAPDLMLDIVNGAND